MELFRSIQPRIELCLSDCFIKIASVKYKLASFLFAFLLIAQHVSIAQKIYWIDRNANEIQRANLDGTGAGLFFDVTTAGSNDPQSIAIDKINNYIYWTDFSGSEVFYGRFEGATLTGASVVFDVGSVVGSPRGIDVDPKDGKVYFANEYEGGLDQMDLDGSNHSLSYVSATGGSGDYEVAVDYPGGKLYWTELASIHRANLSDGGSEETIIGPLTALTIDVAIDEVNRKLYYLQVAGGTGFVNQADLDGTNDLSIVTGLSDQVRSIDVDPVNGKIYWSIADAAAPSISWANLDGSSPQVIIPLTAGADPFSIAVDTRKETFPKIYWTENVGAITNDDEIHRVGLDGSDFEVVYSGFSDEISGIEIDETNNKIYWTDAAKAEIFVSFVDEHDLGSIVKLIDYNPGGTNGLFDLALDVPNNLMYYTHANADNAPINAIVSADFSDPTPQTTISNLIDLGGEEPFGIDLDLANGKIYYTTNIVSTGIDARLYRANLDGTGVEELFIIGSSSPGTFFRDVKIDPN